MEYFTNTQIIKENTPINKNVDDNDIVLYTKIVAERYVEPIIGKDVFNELLEKYNDPMYSLTPEEKEFVKCIEPVINWYTAHQVTLNTTFPVRNKGIQQMSGDYSSEVDYGTMGAIRKQILGNAQFYEKKLIECSCEIGIHNQCGCGRIKTLRNMFFA